MTDFETLKTQLDAGVLTVTLNRPERLNAFNLQMGLDLLAMLDEADADDAVRALVFTGEGRAYCAGADLGGGGATFDAGGAAEASDPTAVPRDGGGLVTLRLFDMKKPVIGAINGAAVGVGATMTLAMDVRLASEKARFGFVFTRRGIVPEAASSWFLPRVVGIGQALEWVLSGRIFPAEEALAGRLVSRVLPPAELLPAAQALAREIAENTSGVSVCLARNMLWKMLGADHPMEAHRVDSRGIFAMGASPDAYEGVQSFLEKRPAEFRMKVSEDLPDFFPFFAERRFDEE